MDDTLYERVSPDPVPRKTVPDLKKVSSDWANDKTLNRPSSP
jgi:hypothetical protein